MAALPTEVGVFAADDIDAIDAFFREHGFVVVRGLFPDSLTDAMELECVEAQTGVVDGSIDERYGTVMLVDDPDGSKTGTFANYVLHIEDLSPAVRSAVEDPRLVSLMARWLGSEAWVEHNRFGVVYQDARPGRESSYTRIGWHSDWQAGPNRDVWPSVAFTFHIDGTSPDNGFLRVVPGSHLWATPAPYENVNGAKVPEGSRPAMGYTETPPPFPMPLRFEKIPGEMAVFVERGDVIFHDAYLWHSAARATSDTAARRHIRGGYFAGQPEVEARYDEFVKNAAR